MKKTPASLRSDPRLFCSGLPGCFALDWVADLNGIPTHGADGLIMAAVGDQKLVLSLRC